MSDPEIIESNDGHEPHVAEPSVVAADGTDTSGSTDSPRTLVCPKCGHESTEYPGDPAHEILHCDECSARIAYGVLMPRIVNEPHPVDRRFVTTRFEIFKDGVPGSITITLDRQLAAMYARDLAAASVL